MTQGFREGAQRTTRVLVQLARPSAYHRVRLAASRASMGASLEASGLFDKFLNIVIA
jgi:hypothetical protein